MERISAVRAELQKLEDEMRVSPIVAMHEGIDALDLARRIYAARRARERHLGADLFADPAWDLLLDLYVNHFERRAVSTSSACIAAAVPATTALRWIDKLEAAGMLFRRPAGSDYRKSHLELTPEALDRMTDLLVKLGAAAQPGV